MLGNFCAHPTPPLNQANDPILNLPQLLDPIQIPNAALPSYEYPRFVRDFPLSDPAVIYWLATLARAVYSPDAALFTSAARAVVPTTYPITYTASTPALTPGFAVLRLPRGTIVVIAGTTNRLQWLAQIFSAGTVPTNYLSTGTDAGQAMGIVKTSADAIYTALAAIGPGEDPVLFVGHSLGGAIAQLLHYRYSIQTQLPVLSRCVAFSSPKPGNRAVGDGMRTTAQVFKRISVAGDFVPMLPPDLGLLTMIAPPVFAIPAASWSSYVHEGTPYYVSAEGAIEAGGDPWFPVAVAQAIATAAAGAPTNPIPLHAPGEMVRRLRAAWSRDLPYASVRNWVNPPQIDVANVALAAAGL